MPAQGPSQQPPAPQQTGGEASNSPAPENTGMPRPERNQYSNKESAKVNSGLDFGLPQSTDTATLDSGIELGSPSVPDVSSVCLSNRPVVAVDFSLLSLPPALPEPQPSLQRLVHRLLHPPAHAFPHSTLSIQWIIGAVGYRHFGFRTSDERWVLKRDSELRNRGKELGIPILLWEWLAGDNEGATATEQSLCLTRAFFSELR
jgi:hypothetical protein